MGFWRSCYLVFCELQRLSPSLGLAAHNCRIARDKILVQTPPLALCLRTPCQCVVRVEVDLRWQAHAGTRNSCLVNYHW